MTDNSKIIKLIVGFVHGKQTRQEREELDAWISESAANRDFFERQTNPERLALARQILMDMDSDAIRRKTDALLKQQEPSPAPVMVIKKDRRNYFWISAAAVLILGVGVYMFTHPDDKKLSARAKAPIRKGFVLPVGSASLVLGDSSVVRLDSLNNGRTIHQGAEAVKMEHRQLVYYSNMPPGEKERHGQEIQVYNTLHVPVQDSRQVLLPDGTRVWLNAGSSLRYPVPFAKTERKVELEGEAFFEVAKASNLPFTVVAGGWSNLVLGTGFNVRAYEGERMIRTTIETGSVAISDGKHLPSTLMPGQEIHIDVGSDSATIFSNVDLASRFAWKEGLFNFRHLDVQTAMRQISRWYGLDEPELQPGAENELVSDGNIDRSIVLDSLLTNLGRGSNLHFYHVGKKIFVNR